MTDPRHPDAAGARRAPTPQDESYARFQGEDRSLGEIAGDVLASASTLLKQEFELAKAEARQSAGRAGKGVGLLVAAGVFALLALVALTLALTRGFALLIGSAASPAWGYGALVTTGLWAVVALVLALAGKGALDKVRGLPRTAETVSKIPNAVTGNEEKNR